MVSTQADLGVDYAAFANWSNGPAHLTWSRGQSTHGVGRPLPRTFADAQLALAKRILARMRGLGMVPVLPSFQGNVPPALKDRFPEANITVQAPHWTSGAVAWLDATDPLFARIGDAFLKRVVAELGAAEWRPGAYHVLRRNCNHLTETLARRLLGASIPAWVNRSANVAAAFGLTTKAINNSITTVGGAKAPPKVEADAEGGEGS